MRKLPSKIIIMGRTIPIKYVSQKELSEMIRNAEGVWDTYTQTIYICKTAPRNIQLYYIYHEKTHAMMTFTGLDQVISPELQEIICQSNATMIQDIIRQASKLR